VWIMVVLDIAISQKLLDRAYSQTRPISSKHGTPNASLESRESSGDVLRISPPEGNNLIGKALCPPS